MSKAMIWAMIFAGLEYMFFGMWIMSQDILLIVPMITCALCGYFGFSYLLDKEESEE